MEHQETACLNMQVSPACSGSNGLDGSQRLTDLKLAECTAQNGDRIWGSWELIFEQPR